jgi:hypothetical protein
MNLVARQEIHHLISIHTLVVMQPQNTSAQGDITLMDILGILAELRQEIQHLAHRLGTLLRERVQATQPAQRATQTIYSLI